MEETSCQRHRVILIGLSYSYLVFLFAVASVLTVSFLFYHSDILLLRTFSRAIGELFTPFFSFFIATALGALVMVVTFFCAIPAFLMRCYGAAFLLVLTSAVVLLFRAFMALVFSDYMQT